MELEVGMFVRTQENGIAKIIEIKHDGFEYKYCLDNKITIFIQQIKKARHNIIDLIEVGDYVNGYKVYEIVDNLICVCDDCDRTISVEDIKSIVTHEQFERVSYKLGKED